MSIIPRVKGTQDFLDLTLYNFVINKARDHLHTYHFTEIATPVLEHTALFTRTLGEQTDVVTKEMFTIATEHDDKKICLRPEATASITRAFVEQTPPLLPWKVFTHGPMFRHERPQKGRFREFHQLSMEIIGSASILQDVQLIKMLDRFFHEQIGIADYALLINFLGCPADRQTYEQTLKTFLNKHQDQLCEKCLVRKDKNSLRVFDCKNETCQLLYRTAPSIIGSLCTSCTNEWQQVQDQLELLSVSFTCQPTLVRGLDYYNKTVFEFVSGALGAQSTFCAGGRYDKLAHLIGSKQDSPSVGAAFGIERLLLILEPLRDKLSLDLPKKIHVIIPLTTEQQPVALLLADLLQAHRITTEVLLEGDSLKSMMRKTNKLGATYALIIGPEEQRDKAVNIKNMITGQEVRVGQQEVLKNLHS